MALCYAVAGHLAQDMEQACTPRLEDRELRQPRAQHKLHLGQSIKHVPRYVPGTRAGDYAMKTTKQ